MPFPIIDFHAHLATLAGLDRLCPEEQQSESFRRLVAVLEPIAHVTEPLHDRMLRQLAMHYNCNTSRSIYALFGKLFLMEAMRLFKRHGLERLIESMDALGIRHTVIHSLEPLTHSAELADELSKYPGRFSVFGSFSKWEEDPVAHLLPLIQQKIIKGIKIHPMIGGFTPDDIYAKTRNVLALASEFELPVAIHTGHIPIEALSGLNHCIRIPYLEPLLKNFPNCKFVFMHCGWESWRIAFNAARVYPNLMLEMSWQPAKVIRRAVDTLGAHRIIFGSDYPLFQQNLALHQVEQALTRSEFEIVTCGNALRLLKMDAAELSGRRGKPLTTPQYATPG